METFLDEPLGIHARISEEFHGLFSKRTRQEVLVLNSKELFQMSFTNIFKKYAKELEEISQGVRGKKSMNGFLDEHFGKFLEKNMEKFLKE